MHTECHLLTFGFQLQGKQKESLNRAWWNSNAVIKYSGLCLTFVPLLQESIQKLKLDSLHNIAAQAFLKSKNNEVSNSFLFSIK